jgi:hypothetical protein
LRVAHVVHEGDLLAEVVEVALVLAIEVDAELARLEDLGRGPAGRGGAGELGLGRRWGRRRLGDRRRA